MQLTELNRECLLHIFSFLDKANRKSLSRTCRVLREVFLEPALWSLLCFSSPSDLRKDNFVLSPALRSLSICWHSSRVKVCNIEDWMKSSFQRDICNRHSNLVNSFLLQISDSGFFAEGEIVGEMLKVTLADILGVSFGKCDLYNKKSRWLVLLNLGVKYVPKITLADIMRVGFAHSDVSNQKK
uniref:F-box and leucine-rich protein 22 isoform X4 n=1 Tax=Pristiophorus japonicus TaxID=55135 RepID=UPI00398EADC7